MTALASYHAARLALADVSRIDEAMELRDEMEHVKLYARQVKDRSLMADATEIQMRAERRLGELLAKAKEVGQIEVGRPPKAPPENGSSERPFPRVRLAEAGISKKLSSKAQAAASFSSLAFEAIVDAMRQKMASGAAIIIDPVTEAEKKAAEAERRAAHARRTRVGGTVEDLCDLAASGFRFRGGMVDVAWHFLTRSPNGEGRSASRYYGTQRDIEAVKALPVAALSAPDALLGFWVMDWDPDLSMARAIIEAWGFVHKTTLFTWAKLNPSGEGWHMGQGYWTRANPETCILATRGHPRRLNADVRQLIVSPVMEHSRKPDAAYAGIERLVCGPYLELNARRERPGWVTWGDELEFKMPVTPAAPEFRRGGRRGWQHTSEARAKIAARVSAHMADPATKAAHSAKMKQVTGTPEYRKGASERQRARMAVPGAREALSAKAKASAAMQAGKASKESP